MTTHDDIPHTRTDLALLRLGYRLPRQFQVRLETLVDSRRWFRWVKHRPLGRVTTFSLPPARNLPHFSPTAKGLRRCKDDCVVCQVERQGVR